MCESVTCARVIPKASADREWLAAIAVDRNSPLKHRNHARRAQNFVHSTTMIAFFCQHIPLAMVTQRYFRTERGRAGLRSNRRESRMLSQ